MSGKDIFNSCILRLGYSAASAGEELYKNLLVRAVYIINDIYCDLYTVTENTPFTPISELTDKIQLKQSCYPALVYGVCAMLCAAANDTEKYNFWSALYSAKRTSMSKICLKKDVL